MLRLLLLDGRSLVCDRFSAAVTSESLKSEVLDIPWEITQISNLKSLDEKGALAECVVVAFWKATLIDDAIGDHGVVIVFRFLASCLSVVICVCKHLAIILFHCFDEGLGLSSVGNISRWIFRQRHR